MINPVNFNILCNLRKLSLLGSSNGFTILEIVLAMGLSLVLLTGVASQMASSSRLMHRFEARMESVQLKQELSFLFENDTKCDKSFSNFPIDIAQEVNQLLATINAQATNHPLKSLLTSYSTNNPLIYVDQFNLTKPLNKIDGSNNDTAPYEFRIALQISERGNTQAIFNINGPRVALNIVDGVADATNSCEVTNSETLSKVSAVFSVSYPGGTISLGVHKVCYLTLHTACAISQGCALLGSPGNNWTLSGSGGGWCEPAGVSCQARCLD